METLSIDLLIKDLQSVPFSFAWIDVRSETEFAQAAVPDTINLPLLLQAERHEIGLAYKHEGQAAAIALGERLVGPHQAARIASWIQAIEASPAQRANVMCWRGGLRSQITCEWLEAAGKKAVQIAGGYKAVRQSLRGYLDEPPPLIVLQGLTGSGKTKLLHAQQHAFIDLEEAAMHRGSAFGALGDSTQPSQASFENDIALQIIKQRAHALAYIVEDESRMLGLRHIPESFLQKMKQAPVVRLEASRDDRACRIYDEYIASSRGNVFEIQRLKEKAFRGLASIERRLDRHALDVRLAMIKAFSGDGDEDAHRAWISMLLEYYYDKRYRHANERHPRRILFSGDFASCVSWLNQEIEGSSS